MRKLWVAFAVAALCTTFTLSPSIAARDKSGVLKASNLIGAKVQDPEGKKLETSKTSRNNERIRPSRLIG